MLTSAAGCLVAIAATSPCSAVSAVSWAGPFPVPYFACSTAQWRKCCPHDWLRRSIEHIEPKGMHQVYMRQTWRAADWEPGLCAGGCTVAGDAPSRTGSDTDSCCDDDEAETSA